MALIYRSDIRVKALHTPGLDFKTFGLLLIKLVNSVSSMTVAIIYRPPSTNVSAFIAELSDLIDSGVLGSMYMVCGDLSCPGPSGTKGEINGDLTDFIDEHSLTQQVTSATCRTGNILDHILSSDRGKSAD